MFKLSPESIAKVAEISQHIKNETPETPEPTQTIEERVTALESIVTPIAEMLDMAQPE